MYLLERKHQRDFPVPDLNSQFWEMLKAIGENNFESHLKLFDNNISMEELKEYMTYRQPLSGDGLVEYES